MQNPLAHPSDKTLLTAYLAHFGIGSRASPEDLLTDVVRVFSSLPYENLTKIIMEREASTVEAARRDPRRVLTDHFDLGSGGTCFSLTAALVHLIRAVGFEAEPILADRHYGPNTHCAVEVQIDSRPHLLDPGYLILEPIPLTTPETLEVMTRFHRISLVPVGNGGKVDLYTQRSGSSSCRLTYKTSPADAGEFLRAWDESFRWEMMSYPLLTRVSGDTQLYLRGDRMLTRSCQGETATRIPNDSLIARIVADFGIAPSVVSLALSILGQERGPHGPAAGR